MKYSDYINKNYKFDRLTQIGIICLVIVISGIFGFLYEYIFYYFNGGMKYFYWRGGDFLPWINIYAIGSLIIYYLTYKYRSKPLKVFIISLMSCGLLEFFSGLGVYIFADGLRLWNYNTEILNFGNIGGFVCLRSVTFFGISSLILMYIVLPFCFYLTTKINKKVFVTISIILCSLVLIDSIYNSVIADLFELPRARDFYTKIGVHYMNYR